MPEKRKKVNRYLTLVINECSHIVLLYIKQNLSYQRTYLFSQAFLDNMDRVYATTKRKA